MLKKWDNQMNLLYYYWNARTSYPNDELKDSYGFLLLYEGFSFDKNIFGSTTW